MGVTLFAGALSACTGDGGAPGPAGDAFLSAVMPGGTLDTTPQVTDPTNARSYAGPRRIRPNLDVVEEIAAAGDFEGVLTFGVGIDERARSGSCG